MSMFRAKKLDLGCFTNVRVLRDHSKRKAFVEAEPERYLHLAILTCDYDDRDR